MDTCKNGRLTPVGREIMVRRVIEGGHSVKPSASARARCASGSRGSGRKASPICAIDPRGHATRGGRRCPRRWCVSRHCRRTPNLRADRRAAGVSTSTALRLLRRLELNRQRQAPNGNALRRNWSWLRWVASSTASSKRSPGSARPGCSGGSDDLEARKAELEAKLAPADPPPVRLHPNLAQLYRERGLTELHSALADPELRTEALELIRSLVERAELHPAEDGFRASSWERSRTWSRSSPERRAWNQRWTGLR